MEGDSDDASLCDWGGQRGNFVRGHFFLLRTCNISPLLGQRESQVCNREAGTPDIPVSPLLMRKFTYFKWDIIPIFRLSNTKPLQAIYFAIFNFFFTLLQLWTSQGMLEWGICKKIVLYSAWWSWSRWWYPTGTVYTGDNFVHSGQRGVVGSATEYCSRTLMIG